MTRARGIARFVAVAIAVATWLVGPHTNAESAGIVAPKKSDAVAESVLRLVESELEIRGVPTRTIVVGCAVEDDACLKQRLRAEQLAMGVRVAVWEATGFRPEPVVSIGLFDPRLAPPYDQVFGEARCEALPCETELRSLVRELLTAWPERFGTELVIEGSPKGAAVFERNRVLGSLPLSVRLPRGAHRLRVSAQGYESQELQVVSGPDQELRRSVRLEPIAAPPFERDMGTRRKRRIVMGSVLVGIGAGLLAAGAVGFARDGQCVAGDPCTSYRERSPGAAVYLGLGGASVGAGVGLLIAGRKR